MRNKNTYPVIIALILFAGSLNGQIYHFNNMFFEEWYSFNPAAAIAQRQTSVALNTNLTGSGIDNAPANYSLTGQTALTEKMGIGVRFNQYNRGYFKTTNFVGSYAYSINVGSAHTINLGLSFGVNNESFSIANIDVMQTEDPKLQNDNISKKTFINEFGVHYTWNGVNAGFAAPYLFQGYNRYLAYASYNYEIPNIENFAVMPNLLFQYLPEKKGQADIVVKINYDMVWGAFSYRTNKDMVASVGANYLNFGFGYAFGFNQGDISTIVSNNHEILLRYNMNSGNNKNASPKQPWK
jgi:type IX secretion system PorP/SprF family membrane protein